MSGSIVEGAIAIVGIALVALGILAWTRADEYRQARRRSRPEQEFSLARYQPMMRLLAGEDSEFLRRYTSCPKVVAGWDRSRRRIIRVYLKELAADFNRVHAAARALVAASPEQYSGLVPILFWRQAAFWRMLVLVEARLALGALDLGKIDAEELVRGIEAMQREIARVAMMSPA